MGIAEKEERLFKDWEKLRKPFVRDGVVCEDAYQASKLKTAFVLKEYANETDGTYDLRKEELKASKYQTWSKVAKILRGIRMMDLSPRKQEEFPCEMHPSICAFNLDKIGGHSGTDMVRLALIAMKDRKFIQRQFAIYDPDLTFCAGTFDIFRYAVGHEDIEEKETMQGVPWYERSSNKYVVGINHTADRNRQPVEDVINAVKEIYRNRPRRNQARKG